ncbi:hypothetical protein ACIQUQ_35145 [Streptomyces sp. NPDC101118]|uniref:hypothetical protein n=1 Tax=Streptomyces sp. NPDC101118 TaxID=3366109 RepID=UPI003825A78C
MASYGFWGRIRVPALGAVALAGGALWWWAALRLVLAPASAGVVEGAVVVGGWGLSLLPVHCVPLASAPGVSAARRRGEGVLSGARGAVTRAWRRRRSGGVSGRS